MNRSISLLELSQIKGVGKSMMKRVLDKLNDGKTQHSTKPIKSIDNFVNKIFNQDCFDILPTIPSKSIDLILTDTPYLHNKGGNGGGNTKIATSNMYSTDSMVMSEMSDFGYDKLEELLNESQRIMKKMNFYSFCNDSLLAYYLYWATINNYKFNILVWEKPLSILNRERYSTNVEYIVRIYEDGVSLNKLDTNLKEHSQKYSKVKKYKVENKIHPTKKPDKYIRDIIELSSNEGDVVLDPFMGEGTTIVNAVNLNRNFIGIEVDEYYYNVVKNRINEHNNYYTK